MTRLIDADALSKDLEKRWNVNDDQDFCNKEVWHALEEAPTIEPDGDLISRQDALAMFEKHCYPITYNKTSRENGMTITGIREVLEQLPSAPDSRQRGEWIEYGDNYGHSSYFCSRCGTQEYKPSGFCPNCGADMRKGDNNGNGI